VAKRNPRPPQVWKRQAYQIGMEQLDWLTGDEGQEVCRRMATDQPAETPAEIAKWRETLSPESVAAAREQVQLRKAARAKFGRADEMLFDRTALEQATDEVVATYKAKRIAEVVGDVGGVDDLCCGIGGDAIAFAEYGTVTAVDRSSLHARMAEHNGRVYGRRIETLVGDVAWHRPRHRFAHIDPDRRASGTKRHDPSIASPGTEIIADLINRYEGMAIKLSPGAEFDTLEFVSDHDSIEIDVISHRGECKQAVVWTSALRTHLRRATVLPSGAQLHADQPEELVWPESRPPEAGGYLYEPDPAVIRADLVGVLARRIDAQPIDPQITWLFAEAPVPPETGSFVQGFHVIDVQPFASRRLRAWLSDHDVGRLEIKTRGFAARPETLQKQLRTRGTREATLLVTRVNERPIAILAERLERKKSEPK
jgi:hypothetical protein